MKNVAQADLISLNIAELLESSTFKEENGNYFGAIEDLERCKEFFKVPKASRINDSRFKNVCSSICRLLNIIAMVFLRKGNLIRKRRPGSLASEEGL